jgi:hypothetical protein
MLEHHRRSFSALGFEEFPYLGTKLCKIFE